MEQRSQSVNGLMTKGAIWKQLVMFSIPLLLGNLFQQLYNAVDSIVVGNYIGESALAAVGSSTPVINLLVSFFMGISVGAGVVISRYYGACDFRRVSKAVHTTLAFALTAGCVMTVIGVLISSTLLKLVGTPDDVMQESTTYLRIYFLGILGVMVYNMGSGILRAVGDSKRPLYYLIISSIINVILDLVFVIVFKMGISGVAWATLIAQATSAILTVAKLMRVEGSYKVYLKQIKFHKKEFKSIIGLGLPSGLQNAIVSFSNVIVQSNINSFGKMAMAGCGSYTKIDGFAILPVMSISMALTTFVGQNMGAKEYARVKKGAKIGIIMSLIITSIIGICLIIFAPMALRIFSSDKTVIGYGVLMMRTVVPGYLFLAVSHGFAGIVRGAGLTKVPMFVMVGCWCGIRMLWILGMNGIFDILNMSRDIRIVFLGYPISWFASALILFIYYKKAKWINAYENEKVESKQV